jgi:hypothetical protein
MSSTTVSPLEAELLRVPAKSVYGELNELSVLRDVLTGACGTVAQRNTLLRIIDQNKVNARSITGRLAAHLGDITTTHEAVGPSQYSAYNLRNAEPTIQKNTEEVFDDEEDDET